MMGLTPAAATSKPEYVPKLEHVKELVSAYNEQIQRRQHNPAYASLVMTSNERQQRLTEPPEPIYVNIL